jgi:hypothetical protein
MVLYLSWFCEGATMILFYVLRLKI